jgi:hypothetical protein
LVFSRFFAGFFAGSLPPSATLTGVTLGASKRSKILLFLEHRHFYIFFVAIYDIFCQSERRDVARQHHV